MAGNDGLPKDNAKVYSGFLTITKWVTILVTLILILMAIFLA